MNALIQRVARLEFQVAELRMLQRDNYLKFRRKSEFNIKPERSRKLKTAPPVVRF